MSVTPTRFRKSILAWYDKYGRKNLPWQQSVTPYKVWLSEVMLQQTQVATVKAYFVNFLERFPEVFDLAHGSLDEVMHLWSGLGYYSRARHLHAAACQIQSRFGGVFPDSLEALMSLPGVGRSTAGAIMSLAFNKPEPILDGNVKRVFARVFMMAGYPEQSAVNKLFWQQAERMMSPQRAGNYNQALMDIGAMICTRSQPLCDECPCQAFCLAHQHGLEAQFPEKKPKKSKPVREWQVLLLIDSRSQTVLLQKRPAKGIWGGLWAFPALEKPIGTQWPSLAHSFTHFDLVLQPWLIELQGLALRRFMKEMQFGTEEGHYYWHPLGEPMAKQIGISVPVKKIIQQIEEQGDGVLRKIAKRA